MDFIFDPSLVLYLPLYKLDGSSFMSKDAYGHLCTVTGALWRPNGRYFDGVDDKIDLGNNSAIKIAKPFTYIMWVYWTSGGLFSTNGASSASGTLDSFVEGGDLKLAVHGYVARLVAVGLSSNTWQMISVVRDAPSWVVYKNDSEADSRTHSQNPTNFSDFIIGQDYNGKLSGRIGEFAIYNRPLTSLEIHSYYLATKWRYR